MTFLRRYISSVGYFVGGQVLRDVLKSLRVIGLELLFVIICLVWAVVGPFVALFDTLRPGLMDRWLFQWARK